MKGKLLVTLMALVECLDNQAQQPNITYYTGIEYLKLKSELARGWNTWNTQSVLSHILLPEGISVELYLKDKNTGHILKEALMGRRGEGAKFGNVKTMYKLKKY